MSTLHKLIQSQSLTPAELKLTKQVRASLEAIEEVVRQTDTDKPLSNEGEWRSHYHLAADKALAAISTNPTIEAVETYHSAIMRQKQAELTAGLIHSELAIASAAESQKLAPITARILDDVEGAIDADSAKRIELLSNSGSELFSADDLTNHKRAVAALKASLVHERRWASEDPAGWLSRNGIA